MAMTGSAPLGPPRPVQSLRAIDEATDGGEWRGHALLVYAVGDWSVFEDLSGGLGDVSPERWVSLAGEEELLFAGYNDAIPYGELVHVRDGRVTRAFFDHPTEPERRSAGTAPPLASWIDVASLVDGDPILAEAPPDGLLWLFRGT